MNLAAILLAGLGVSLLIEGLVLAAAPRLMRDVLKSLAALPDRELVIAGAVSAGLGAAVLAVVAATA